MAERPKAPLTAHSMNSKIHIMSKQPNVNCQVCGIAFYRKPHGISSSKSGFVYCSRSCYGVACRRVKKCPICKSEFPQRKKYCSRSCANRGRIGTLYKTGRKSDLALKAAALKKRIAIARGFNCESCGYDKHPEILVVHHIVPSGKGGSDDFTNLLLLCPNCHAEIHLKMSEDTGGTTWIDRTELLKEALGG